MPSALSKIARAALPEEVFRRLKLTYQPVARRVRCWTASYRCLPDFIILGAQKSGTTSLYKYLRSHSQVIPAECKEVHFFDNNYDKGLAWYRSHFPLSVRMKLRDGAMTGEASPYYLYHPLVPRRIARILPEAKLIMLLRNPVDRAISHYWHQVEAGREELPMEEAFAREEERLDGETEQLMQNHDSYSYNHQQYSYLDRGKYVEQIDRFLDHFRENQLLICKSEHLFRRPQETFDRVTRFLGIRTERIQDVAPKNTGSYHRAQNSELRATLEGYFREPNEELEERFGIRF